MAGYCTLQIRLSNAPDVVRHLYLKPHSGEGLPAGRALFVAGLPVALDEAALLALFGAFGDVERAAVHGSRLSAVVLYAGAAGAAAALAAAARGRAFDVRLPPPAAPYGLKAWVEAHKAERPGNDALQASLDAWTEAHEAAEAAAAAAARAAMEGDGWTVVQRHRGRRKNVGAGGVTVGGVAAAAAAARAKPPATSPDFYRFQRREARRSQLMELRERFEQDKQRIRELKAARKWKPV